MARLIAWGASIALVAWALLDDDEPKKKEEKGDESDGQA